MAQLTRVYTVLQSAVTVSSVSSNMFSSMRQKATLLLGAV
jgi:hypothetical protein